MFQIMGFNYESCGEKSVKAFVQAMHENELRQLRLSAIFLKKQDLYPTCKTKTGQVSANAITDLLMLKTNTTRN